MSDAANALQKALKETLAADSAIGALIGAPPRLYDDVPRNAVFPYVTLGEAALLPFDTDSDTGFVHLPVFHVWSRQGGRKEAKTILGALYAALHRAVPSLDGHILIDLRFLAADIFRDEDGETYHGVARFRALTEPET